jgi:mannosyltransferase OCH1-like enzyme
MIPKILHYVWVGGPLPRRQQDYIATWRETNPSFEVMRWNEDNIDMSHPTIKRAYARKKWAKVADIARLQAVGTMGGIYLDTDFKLFKPLDPLLSRSCFFAFQEAEDGTDWVSNGAFGATPGHWFIKQALDELRAMRPSPFLPERPTAFGPKHITRLLRRSGLTHYSPDGVMVKDIFVAPVRTFFPFHFRETFTPACVTEQTLGAHFWEKSWEGTIPLPVRLARTALKRLRLVA